MTEQHTRNLRLHQPSRFWWLRKPKYIAIFLRELSSFFILAYVILFSLQLIQAGRGESAYKGFLAFLGSPPLLLVGLILLLFAAYHSITFFSLVPRVQPLKLGRRPLPLRLASSILVIAWLIASYLVVTLVFG